LGGVPADPAGFEKTVNLKKEDEKMKKTAVLFSFMIGLFLVISGWGLVPQLYAAPVEIKLGHVDPADICISKKGAAGAAFKGLVEGATGAM